MTSGMIILIIIPKLGHQKTHINTQAWVFFVIKFCLMLDELHSLARKDKNLKKSFIFQINFRSN